MTNEKGGLIKKKKKPTIMQPAVPVKKSDMDFGFTAPIKKEEPTVEKTVVVESVAKPPVAPIVEKEEVITEPEKRRKAMGVGKSNTTKSLKVPTVIHSELNLLGSFMDENKTYIILQKLIDSYVQNELTNRQQRQFEYMVDAFNEEK